MPSFFKALGQLLAIIAILAVITFAAIVRGEEVTYTATEVNSIAKHLKGVGIATCVSAMRITTHINNSALTVVDLDSLMVDYQVLCEDEFMRVLRIALQQ